MEFKGVTAEGCRRWSLDRPQGRGEGREARKREKDNTDIEWAGSPRTTNEHRAMESDTAKPGRAASLPPSRSNNSNLDRL